MKDYSKIYRKSEERKTYILYYEINEKGNILVHYADGNTSEHEYSKELEEHFLFLMRCQFDMYDSDIKHRKNVIRYEKLLSFALFGGSIAGTYCVYQDLPNQISLGSTVSCFAATGSWSLVGLLFLLIALKDRKIIKDYDKTEMFLENEAEINKYLMSQSRPDTNVEVSRTLTINDIGRMKYGEIVDLVEISKKVNSKVLTLDINKH